MKKLFFYLVIFSAASFISWKYLPDQMREQTASIIGRVLGRNTNSVETQAGAGKEKIMDALPKSPSVKRESLVKDLENQITGIKEKLEENPKISTQAILKELTASEETIKEIKGIDEDSSLTGKTMGVIERISEKFFTVNKCGN